MPAGFSYFLPTDWLRGSWHFAFVDRGTHARLLDSVRSDTSNSVAAWIVMPRCEAPPFFTTEFNTKSTEQRSGTNLANSPTIDGLETQLLDWCSLCLSDQITEASGTYSQRLMPLKQRSVHQAAKPDSSLLGPDRRLNGFPSKRPESSAPRCYQVSALPTIVCGPYALTLRQLRAREPSRRIAHVDRHGLS